MSDNPRARRAIATLSAVLLLLGAVGCSGYDDGGGAEGGEQQQQQQQDGGDGQDTDGGDTGY